MRLYKAIVISILFLAVLQLKAQSLYLDFLFNAGVTYSSEIHAPSTVNDSVNFGFHKHRLNFIVPLKTKLGVELKNLDFKKMDAKASQLFLTAGGGFNQVSFDERNEKGIYRGNIGVTGINAGIRNGIWMYSANVFFNESEQSFKKNFTPNFRGYLAKIKVKNLDFIYFYGAALVVNQGRIIPVPIGGFHKKIASNFRATVIFPIEAKINKKLSSKLNMDLGVNYDGINTIYREGSFFQNNDQTVNYRQLKPYLAANTKIEDFKIRMELGWSTFQSYYQFGEDSQTVKGTPYLAISLNYQLGHSLFGQVFKPKE